VTTEWWTELKSITLHQPGEEPPLWAEGASMEHRAARLALAEEEQALSDQVEAVAARRRTLPPGPRLDDYQLTAAPLDLAPDGEPRPVRLTDLFGGHDELVVYHLMFHPDDDAACAMCSLWVDGLHGVAHHLTRRAGLAVIAKAPVDKLAAWGRRRGWRGLPLVSAYDSTFAGDVGAEAAGGGMVPAFSVFVRDGDDVRHAYIQSADFGDGRERGIDRMSAVWNVFDLLPSGRGDWLPDNSYPGATRGPGPRAQPG
jgi:predicted dithiol-disulfide oxidoreductase (DUF899 family)